MAKLHFPSVLQLLFGLLTFSLVQKTSANIKYVHPGENITLYCDITKYYEISWYHQSEEELKLLISAKRGILNNTFFLSSNVDEDHYDVNENSSTVDLVIIGVNEADLGLYFCGGRDKTTLSQFGKHTRLTFTGDSDEDKVPPDCPDAEFYWIIIIILTSVCLVSFLLNIIFICVLCYRKQGKCCSNAKTGGSFEKEEDLQYASLKQTAVTRRSAGGNRASAQDSVIYSGVIS